MYLPHILPVDWIPQPLWHYLDAGTQRCLKDQDADELGDTLLQIPLRRVAENSGDLSELYLHLSQSSDDVAVRQGLVNLVIPGILSKLIEDYASKLSETYDGSLARRQVERFDIDRCNLVLARTAQIIHSTFYEIINYLQSSSTPSQTATLSALEQQIDSLPSLGLLMKEDISKVHETLSMALVIIKETADIEQEATDLIDSATEQQAVVERIRLASLDAKDALNKLHHSDSDLPKELEDLHETFQSEKKTVEDFLGLGDLILSHINANSIAQLSKDDLALCTALQYKALSGAKKVLSRYGVFLQAVTNIPNTLPQETLGDDEDTFESVDNSIEVMQAAKAFEKSVQKNIAAVRRYTAYVAIQATASVLQILSDQVVE